MINGFSGKAKLAVGAVCLVLATILGWNAAKPNLADVDQQETTQWAALTWSSYDPTQAYRQLMQYPMLPEGLVLVDEKEKPVEIPDQWSLAGIYKTGQQTRAVVMITKEGVVKTEHLGVGSDLPGGRVIKEIADNSILISEGGSVREISVFDVLPLTIGGKDQ